MFTEYLDCKIEIQPRSGDVFPFSVSAPGGDARGALRLPTGDPTYQELAEQLANLTADEEALIQIGQTLFNALFQGQSKEVLLRSQGVLKEGQGLRIVLNIAATEQEVGALPWEFLYDPDMGPLVMLDTPIVRYLQQSALIPKLKTDLPLKVLLTGAQPGDQAPIGVERELREVKAALATLEQQRRMQVVVEPHLSRSKLQQLLRQGFHVWHFAGHGGFSGANKNGALAFEDAQGDLEWASALELGILLNRSSVRLIVLDACQSGQLAVEPFRGIAPALIRAQVPAVIAMQFTIPDKTARAFAAEFYQALAEGFPIDACVTEGRKAVMGEVGLGRPDWGIPVVYTRAADGKLFDLLAATAMPMTATPAPAIDKQTSTPVDISVDDRATRIGDLRQLIRTKRRYLQELEMQRATMGTYTPPMISMGITDTEREIATLERQFKELDSGTRLGGDDYDQRIVNWIIDEVKADGIDLSRDRQALQRLTEAVQKAKIELSSLMETEINLPFITADATGPKHLQITLTRGKLEQLTKE
jgi:hypothetical protein